MKSSVLPALSNQSVMDATRVRTLRDLYGAWRAQNLPTCVADAGADAGIDTVGQVARFDLANCKSRPNVELKTLRELPARLKECLAAPTPSPRQCPSRYLQTTREAVVDAVIALRRNGFRPFAFKRWRSGDV